jgi:hypothetical protein
MATTNGKRRPPRPAIEFVASSATPEEAAAIAAALERFLHDTTPPLTTPQQAPSAWERAALAEGVGLSAASPWGDAPGWE